MGGLRRLRVATQVESTVIGTATFPRISPVNQVAKRPASARRAGSEPSRGNTTPDHPTAIEGQQEEINVATGQAQEEAQRINIINPSNSTLKGNPPFIFDGDRSKTHKFLTNWDLWVAINRNNNIMKKPFSKIVTLLSYIDGIHVDDWKHEQLLELQKEADNGALKTDEKLWTNFIARFNNTFTNQNHRSEAY